MIYKEFLIGTNAPETKETYEQYKVIAKIYRDCEKMTKADAYAIWKRTYGRELKAKRNRMLERVNTLIDSRLGCKSMSENDKLHILAELRRMYQNVLGSKDSFSASFYDGKSYTDEYGIVWFIKDVDVKSNGDIVTGLFANVNGVTIDAHYRV